MCGRFQMTPEAWAAASRLASVPDFIEIPLGFIYPGTPAGILTAGKEGSPPASPGLAGNGTRTKDFRSTPAARQSGTVRSSVPG